MPRDLKKTSKKNKTGFAVMDKELQRKIAGKGGKAAHEKGTAHEWDSIEAKHFGKIGGECTARKRREREV